MIYTLDCEFFEDGYKRIDLISIALVCEDGREFYAVASDGWDPRGVSDWLKANVLPFLSPDGQRVDLFDGIIASEAAKVIPFRSREQIKEDLWKFVKPEAPPVVKELEYIRGRSFHNQPEFWGYFADYDWVLLCQLFGRMLDLPSHFPKYCRDIKQKMDDHQIEKVGMPKQESGHHNALMDARHMQKMLLRLAEMEEAR
jgi:hypothetical protein